MKQSITGLSRNIIILVRENKMNYSDDEIEKMVSNFISWYFDDTFKMIKNICETSLSRGDAADRIFRLEEKFEIPKTHLILNESILNGTRNK